MKNSLLWLAFIAVVLGLVAFLNLRQQGREELAVSGGPVVQSSEAAIRHPIAAPTEMAEPLPELDASDGAVRERFAALLEQQEFARLIRFDRLIRRLVVTVDNLDRPELPQKLLPLRNPAGSFLVRGAEDQLTLSSDNTKRYAPYVRLAEAVDSQTLVGAYTRFYPLFQQAYVDLGYPAGYFNDRLIEILDHLLATPAVREPVRLTQPKVAYLFADPTLEKLSAGQKLLIRIGPENSAKIRVKLLELRRALTNLPPQR